MSYKLKTKKTLMKRLRITRKGKMMKKQNGNRHLKIKQDSSRKERKNHTVMQPNAGHIKVIKKLLAKAGKDL